MKIAILNVKYSENLGDGAIADCLESQLHGFIPHAHIFSLDVGGREGFNGGGTVVSRLRLMDRLSFLSAGRQDLLKSLLLPLAIRARYHRAWTERLRDCDALVVGGGQLFQDLGLYFPLRISRAIKAAPRGIPVFVHAAGVSRVWSARGRALFQAGLAHGRLQRVAVRDRQSQVNWEQHFGNAPAPLLVHDPALLAVDCYGLPTDRPRAGRSIVALGVSDPADLRAHCERPEDVVCSDVGFYLDAIRLLSTTSDVLLFTNGADPDRAFMKEEIETGVATLPAGIRSRVTILPAAATPEELVRQIAGADGLIAHRLHANILAYSLRIPHVGLGWDKKMVGFFDKVGRRKFLITTPDVDAAGITSLLRDSLREGIDEDRHADVLKEARESIAQLAAAIRASDGRTES